MSTTTPQPVNPSPYAAPAASANAGVSSRGAMLALAAALLGWMFDGAEMGLFSLVGRSAMKDLLAVDNSIAEGDVAKYFGVVTAMFLVGAATGGVLFGWLGDRIGRVRAMTLSVLTYALFTGACGLAGAAWQVALLRFIAALGMGGEWSLGVALVMEIWPNRSRAFLAGLIGAAANVGYLLVALVGLGMNSILSSFHDWLIAVGLSEQFVVKLTANQGWRLIMMVGTLPALLTFFIRLFVPESQRWQEEKDRGGTSHWATRDLLGVAIGALGPALIIFVWAAADVSSTLRMAGTVLGLVMATVGYTFPVAQFLKRDSVQSGRSASQNRGTLRTMLLAAGLSGVALLGTWGSAQWAPSWAHQLTKEQPGAREWTLFWMSAGAIVGTIAAAQLGDWLGRRIAYCLLCLLSLGSVVLLFQFNTEYGPQFLASGFIAGVCTASFYGWLPLYLPELFRTGVRATGQGFGFNFGRILAAVGALQTGYLFKIDVHLGSIVMPGGYPTSCTLISSVYLVGMALIWLAPETRGKTLPD